MDPALENDERLIKKDYPNIKTFKWNHIAT
jgi:hypothetical protein